MTRDEWGAVLAVEPLTPAQLGAVGHELRRLGFRGRYDRPARLAASAALLGLGELDSTKSLTMGQAGQLLRVLRGFAGRRERGTAGAAGVRGVHQAGRPPRQSAGWSQLTVVAASIALASGRL